MRPETKLQIEVCEFLQDNYPSVVFHSDLSAGAALSIGQAVMNKRLQFSNGMPDLYILEPRNGFSGLMLELKREGFKLMKKDASWSDERVEKQSIILAFLRSKGYRAEFAIGLAEAKRIINLYLS